MKVEVTEDYDICLKEVYSGVMMETREGNRIGICMRDDTFEINVIPKDKKSQWWRVNMQTGEMEKEIASEISNDGEKNNGQVNLY